MLEPQEIAAASGRPEASRWLAALRTGAAINAPLAVVVAHPDDETLGLGGRLASFRALRLVHLTDGAPEDLADAQRSGFADRRAYALARWAELAQALDVLGVKARREAFGLADQSAVFQLAWLSAALAERLAQVAAVVTHPYEGGHPDHDAASFAVQMACRVLRARTGRAPLRLEFAGYHLAHGRRVTGRFWPAPGAPQVAAELDADALARKRAAIACFRTQADVTAWFDPADEAYRAAPTYDFTTPPPPGASLYDGYGWRLTSEGWREQAHAALCDLAAGDAA